MATQTNPRTETSVANGIAILKTAIKENLSLSEASRQHKFGRNYVSDVKARLADNLKAKNIKRDTYRAFRETLKAYNAL